MSWPALPPWIEVKRGSGPVLLLAPHGGRRFDVRIPGKHKVNDLRTADVTRELAGILDAGAIVNERIDRTELDLNRVSQVRRDAPWLIDLLAEMLAEIVERWGRATVLVVHGWNVSQVACDVGIGMRDDGGRLAPCRAGSATVSDEFVASRLRPLQASAAADGIAVTIGSRYPAAHPNNLLQIFRELDDTEAPALPCPVGTLLRRAVVDAVQLELAIPLRWPGARRDRFLALLGAAFGERRFAPDAGGAGARPDLRALGGRPVRRRGLQLVTDDLLLMTSIESGDGGAVGGRVVLSEDARRLSLFTGELADTAHDWAIPPLTYAESPPGRGRFTYAGPLVTFPSHTPFLDLERGLADGTLVEGTLDLTFAPDRGAVAADASFGDVRGTLVVDGREYAIATRGLATSADGPMRTRFPHCRITLTVGPAGATMLAADSDEPPQWVEGRLRAVFTGIAGEPSEGVRLRLRGEVRLGSEAGTLFLAAPGAGGWDMPLAGTLERLLPVRRPGPFGSVIETTFALIRVDGRSVGWLELSVVHTPDAAPPVDDVSAA
jgi:hypothetical protein